MAALDEVMKGRTTFVIAHRLSTVKKATRIVLFEGGRVETGTFDGLVAAGGHFARLARSQFLVAPKRQAAAASAHPTGTDGEAADREPRPKADRAR